MKSLLKPLNGLALIMVLILLQLLSIIGLYVLHLAWMQTKQSQYLWNGMNVEINSEKSLQVIEKKLIENGPECIIPLTITSDLLKKSLYWWQTKACAGNLDNFKYYYVIEMLGIDSCGLIQVADKNVQTDYYRITLLGIWNNNKIVLQSTLGIPSPNLFEHCDGRSHIITAGRQMWRKLNIKENKTCQS